MNRSQVLIALRNTLVRLYPTEVDARRIVDDAGVESGNIAFTNQALNNWHAILTEFNRRGQLNALLDIALAEYPENQQLRTVCHDVRVILAQQVGQDDMLAESAFGALHSPFIGPAPFQSEHASLFFGREAVLKSLIDRLVKSNSPILVVNGLSGVGKTSLLRAGLVPQLQEQGFSVAYTSILDNPNADTIHGIRNAFGDQFTPDSNADIPSTINALACPRGRPVILIVDQLERCFTLTKDDEERNRFWRGIAQLLAGEVQCSTKILLAVRSDWLYAFQEVSPTLDISIFNFLFRLEPLTVKEARDALTGPLDLFEIAYDPSVIDTILADLAGGSEYIHPPQLQIVGEAVYRYLQKSDQPGKLELSLEDYQNLRGARIIIRDHLVSIVNSLGPNAQTGWRILLQLVGADGLRVSKRAEELRGNISPEQFIMITENFVKNALLMREISSADNVPVYTLTHDYLIEEINHYIEQNLEVQAWRMADHYLDSGLADWRESRQISDAELFLDKSRYLYIWSHREILASLTDEANVFLTRTALHHGEASFDYWLDQLPKAEKRSHVESIAEYVLVGEHDEQVTIQRAIDNAVKQHQLSETTGRQLAERFWLSFAPTMAAAAPTLLEDGATEQTSATDNTTVPKAADKAHQESRATLLWSLRPYLTRAQLLRVAPLASRRWLRLHRTQLLWSMAGALLVSLVVLVAWVMEASTHGNWQRMPPLMAGPISAAAIVPSDPEAIYTITPRGPNIEDGATLLRRTGPTGAWEILSRNFTNQQTKAMLVAEKNGQTRLYVSLFDGGIIRSDDDGQQWAPINNGLLSFSIRSLVADPANPDLLYAGSEQQRGVFASQDGGNSWQDISGDKLFGTSIRTMIFTNHEGGALLVGTEHGQIWRRPRGAAEWNAVATIPGVGSIEVLVAEPTTGQTVYAGTSNGTVLISENGGQIGWRPQGKIPDAFTVFSMVVLPETASTVFANTFGIGGNLVWKSEDFGKTWQQVGDRNFSREQLSLLVHRQTPHKIYAVGHPGFFETDDSGNTWHFDPNVGSPLASIRHMAISPVVGGPLFLAVGGAIYASMNPDAGLWIRGNGLPALVVNDIIADPQDPKIAYAAVHLPNRWSIFMTTDSGKTWQSTAPPPNAPEEFFNYTSSLAVTQRDGQSILFAGTNICGVVTSNDGGQSWQALGRANCMLTDNEPRNVLDLAIDPHIADKLYVAAERNHVYTTVDHGTSWRVAEIEIAGDIRRLVVDPNIKERVYLIAGADGFWRSADGAQTWTNPTVEFEGRFLVDLVAIPDISGTLYVAASDGMVWQTIDGGVNWVSIRENLSTTEVSSMAYNRRENELLLASWLDGLYRFRPGSIGQIWTFREEK